MGLVEQQIKDEFVKFSEQFGPAAIVMATVTAVNDDDTVAVIFSDGSTVDDVRLKAIVKAGNKVLLIPAAGSIVLVGRIRNSDEYVIVSVSEISEIQTVIGTVTQSVNEDGLLFQKGTDTLKDALVLFVEAMEPIVILEGRNPDLVKLAQAKVKLLNILR
jgi:exosome complex RNA-binding protein Csl4